MVTEHQTNWTCITDKRKICKQDRVYTFVLDIITEKQSRSHRQELTLGQVVVTQKSHCTFHETLLLQQIYTNFRNFTFTKTRRIQRAHCNHYSHSHCSSHSNSCYQRTWWVPSLTMQWFSPSHIQLKLLFSLLHNLTPQCGQRWFTASFVKISTIAATVATFNFCLTDLFFSKDHFLKYHSRSPKRTSGDYGCKTFSGQMRFLSLDCIKALKEGLIKITEFINFF